MKILFKLYEISQKWPSTIFEREACAIRAPVVDFLKALGIVPSSSHTFESISSSTNKSREPGPISDVARVRTDKPAWLTVAGTRLTNKSPINPVDKNK